MQISKWVKLFIYTNNVYIRVGRFLSEILEMTAIKFRQAHSIQTADIEMTEPNFFFFNC